MLVDKFVPMFGLFALVQFRLAMFFLTRLRNLLWSPARSVLVNSVMLTTLCAVFAALSGAGYLAAYRALIPTVQIERNVHFKYAMRPCLAGQQCQHPVAEVWLSADGAPALTAGVDYRIELNLQLPESETNFDMGMFMASVELRAANGAVLRSAQRSGVLVYRSSFLRLLSTVLSLPSLLLGEGQEKQSVRLAMFDSFVDWPQSDQDFAASAHIELHSADIQIYSAQLRIFADFGGLRYLMYRWPLTSALVGCVFNFVVLWVSTALFWLRYKLFGVARVIVKRGRSASGASKNNKADSAKNGHATKADKKTSTPGDDVVDEDKVRLMNGSPTSGLRKTSQDHCPENGLIAKVWSRLPVVSYLQPWAASIVDLGVRWSPVPVPGLLVAVVKQVVGHPRKIKAD